MTIKELKKIIENIDDDFEVIISLKADNEDPFESTHYSIEKDTDIGFLSKIVLLFISEQVY